MLTSNWIHYEVNEEDEFLVKQLGLEVADLCDARKEESIFEESKGVVSKLTELMEKEEQNDRIYKIIYTGITIGITASFDPQHLTVGQVKEIENLAAGSVISTMKAIYENMFLTEFPLSDGYADQAELLGMLAEKSVAHIPDYIFMTREELGDIQRQRNKRRNFGFFKFES